VLISLASSLLHHLQRRGFDTISTFRATSRRPVATTRLILHHTCASLIRPGAAAEVVLNIFVGYRSPSSSARRLHRREFESQFLESCRCHLFAGYHTPERPRTNARWRARPLKGRRACTCTWRHAAARARDKHRQSRLQPNSATPSHSRSCVDCGVQAERKEQGQLGGGAHILLSGAPLLTVHHRGAARACGRGAEHGARWSPRWRWVWWARSPWGTPRKLLARVD